MNETLILEIIFWSALFMVFYTYLGYGMRGSQMRGNGYHLCTDR